MKALAGTVYWVSTEFLLLSSPAVRLAAAVAGVVNGTKCCHAVFVFGTNDEYSAVGRKTHLLSALRQFFWGPYRVFFCYRVSVVRDCLVNLAPPTSAANLDDANENKLRRKSLHGLKRIKSVISDFLSEFDQIRVDSRGSAPSFGSFF